MSGNVLSTYESDGHTWARVECDCMGQDEDCIWCDWQERGIRTVILCDSCDGYGGYCQCDEEELTMFDGPEEEFWTCEACIACNAVGEKKCLNCGEGKP